MRCNTKYSYNARPKMTIYVVGGERHMPYHKPLKIKNQQNKSSVLEESRTIRPAKAAHTPPSLNGIPKQES